MASPAQVQSSAHDARQFARDRRAQKDGKRGLDPSFPRKSVKLVGVKSQMRRKVPAKFDFMKDERAWMLMIEMAHCVRGEVRFQ